MASDITMSPLRNNVEASQVKNHSLVDNIDAYDDTAVRKVITKKDLWICSLRGLFMEGNFNFERMQGGGFAYSIIPALKKIHGNNRNDLAKALKNHLQFFNASPKLFTFL
ncbi:PTS system mannose/fructose/sorbose family transporter subunit IID, partial [Aeromonas hydrophila]